MAVQTTAITNSKWLSWKKSSGSAIATFGIIALSLVIIVGMGGIWLFGGKSSKSPTSTSTPTASVAQRPVDVPSLGPVVRSFTDADCGKNREITLSFGERATFSGMCPIIHADVTDGAMLFRYQNGKTHLMMPYATSPIRDSAMISVTGASTVKASYLVKFGPLQR